MQATDKVFLNLSCSLPCIKKTINLNERIEQLLINRTVTFRVWQCGAAGRFPLSGKLGGNKSNSSDTEVL